MLQSPTPAPVTDEEIRSARTTSSAIVTHANGKTEIFPLSYQVLYSSGDAIGGWSAGTIVDRNGQVLQSAVIDDKGTTAKGPFHSRGPDANSLIRHGKSLFLVTHFEYDTEAPNVEEGTPPVSLYGRLPIAMNIAQLTQDGSSGALR